VSFVTEDTVRADLDFVVDLYNACTAAGAHRVVICDTVGVMTPDAIKWFFERLKPRLRATELSFHGHNDFGMAVANSLAAIEAGETVPHTCVNGLGERSGNASFEELVLALEALHGYDTGIDVSRIYEVSQLASGSVGSRSAWAKPLVGHKRIRSRIREITHTVSSSTPHIRTHPAGDLVDSGRRRSRVVSVKRLQGEDELLEARVSGPLPETVDAGVGTVTPASMAARLFATAMPKSLWPWKESSVARRRGLSRSKNHLIASGVITPTVSQITTRWAPAAVHAL